MKKKLKLNRTTVRALSGQAVGRANGGSYGASCDCHTWVCYPIELTGDCSNWCGITQGGSCTCSMGCGGNTATDWACNWI